MSTTPRYLDGEATLAAITPQAAVEAIGRALSRGFRPESDHRRFSERLRDGEFLIMPSEAESDTGVKVLTVAPLNPTRGLPRIQGLYILFDSDTLTPRLLLDGSALTTIRTPAVSFAAMSPALLRRREPLRVAVYGAGPQALAHLRTLRAVLAGVRAMGTVTMIVPDPGRIGPVDAVQVAAVGSSEAVEATGAAELILCATTARTPLFDSRLVGPQTIVIAVGSHEPEARELDAALLGRAQVVVEDPATALRECGDVVLAIAERALTATALLPMAEVVTGATVLATDRPVVFKSSGMSWEDLVVAAAIAENLHDGGDRV